MKETFGDTLHRLPSGSRLAKSSRQRSGELMPHDPQPTCPICHDGGLYRVDRPVGDPDFGRVFVCECQSARQSARFRALSGLRDAERTISLNGIEVDVGPGTRQMVEACRAFIRRPAGILTVWGGPGNAKSTVLQAVVNELVRVGAVYITAYDLISHIRDAIDTTGRVHSDDAYSRLKLFEGIRVLAIDEFDKLRLTDWVTEQITDLIDKRYRGGLAGELGTLLAMNCNPADQPEWIASRLMDGRNLVVHNGDQDVRPYMKGGSNRRHNDQ